MIVIFIALLYYYLGGIFIGIKPCSSSGLSILEVALPFFLVLTIVLSALLGVCLLQQSAPLWAAGSARSQLAFFVLLKLLHDLLSLV